MIGEGNFGRFGMFRAASRRTVRTAGTLVLAATAALIPKFAYAAAPSDPDATLAKIVLTDEVTQKISPQDYAKNAPTGQQSTQSAAIAGAAGSVQCWSTSATYTGKNLLGGTLFTFTSAVNWCGDGIKVKTSAYGTVSHTENLGWEYHGLTRNYNNGGINSSYFETIREGQFCYANCLVQNKLQLVDTTVTPTGQVTRRT